MVRPSSLHRTPTFDRLNWMQERHSPDLAKAQTLAYDQLLRIFKILKSFQLKRAPRSLAQLDRHSPAEGLILAVWAACLRNVLQRLWI